MLNARYFDYIEHTLMLNTKNYKFNTQNKTREQTCLSSFFKFSRYLYCIAFKSGTSINLYSTLFNRKLSTSHIQ